MGRPLPVRGAATGLAFLALASALNYYDRVLVVVVSQPLRLEFKLTDMQYGLLTGPAFVVVYALSSLLFGALADRCSRRGVISVALCLWSMMTALCGFANSFALLALSRAGVGVGEGASMPAGLSMLSDYYPAHRRSMAMAIFNSGGMIGLCLSFVLGSWIATHFGWRSVFFIAGLPGLLLALFFWIMVREPARGAHDVVAPRSITYRAGLTRLIRNRAYCWLTLAASLGTFSSLGMMIWLPQFFIRAHHLTQGEVGMLFGPAAALGLLAGMMAGGWLGTKLATQRLERPVLVCIFANAALLPLYLFVLWIPSTTLALVATFVAMATSVIYAPAYHASMQSVCEPEVRGTAAAVASVASAVIGQGAIPLLVGMTSDHLAAAGHAEPLRMALSLTATIGLFCAIIFVRGFMATRQHFRLIATASRDG